MIRLREPYVFPSVGTKLASVSVTGSATQTYSTDVGAGAVSTIAGGLVYLVAAGVEGAFSYALYTGKYIFTERHPIWGTIFALLTMTHLYKAGDRLTGG